MSKIKFWVAISKAKQLAFRENGTQYEIDVDLPVGEQHMVYSEILLCRQGRESLKGKLGAKKQKTVQNRIPGVPMCPKCEKKFKENQDLDWQRWISPPELKRQTQIQINPQLTGQADGNEKSMVRAESRKTIEDTGEDIKADQAGILFHSER